MDIESLSKEELSSLIKQLEDRIDELEQESKGKEMKIEELSQELRGRPVVLTRLEEGKPVQITLDAAEALVLLEHKKIPYGR